MEEVPVTHEQIYDRLCVVESKIDAIESNTKDIIEAFKAAQGALKVLNWIAGLAKPIAVIVGIGAFFTFIWHNTTGK
jgi:hypothetical protein